MAEERFLLPPEALKQSVLEMNHDSPLASHPGSRRMYRITCRQP